MAHQFDLGKMKGEYREFDADRTRLRAALPNADDLFAKACSQLVRTPEYKDRDDQAIGSAAMRILILNLPPENGA